MRITDAIRELRNSLNDSQQAFSNRLGVTVTTVSRWETNRIEPSLAFAIVMWRLANSVGASKPRDAFARLINATVKDGLCPTCGQEMRCL